MGLTTLLGKLLIVASIAFQGYILFADSRAASSFDKQLGQAISNCSWFNPEIKALIKQHLRLAVAGLLGTSLLLLVIRNWTLKLPTLIGLGLLVWVEHYEVFRKVPTLAILENTPLWHSLGLIGVVIYLIGAECTGYGKNEPKGATIKEVAEPKAEAENEANRRSREKKRN